MLNSARDLNAHVRSFGQMHSQCARKEDAFQGKRFAGVVCDNADVILHTNSNTHTQKNATQPNCYQLIKYTERVRVKERAQPKLNT